MKLILITLVALVVGLMVACGGGDSRVTESKPLPTVPPPPAYSAAEVIGAVKGFLNGPGMENVCKRVARTLPGLTITVRQDPSNRDKYLVTVDGEPSLSWTFVGSLGKVISTSTGQIGAYGC